MVPVGVAATTDAELARAVLALGRAEGLDAVGVAPAGPMQRARAALEQRKAAGLHAGMEFTYRNPARSTDPGGLVRGARAVVVGARRYPAVVPPPPAGPAGAPPERVGGAARLDGPGLSDPPDQGPAGRVARYAWADHYGPLRDALWAVARHLRAAGHRAVVFADDNSLVDRESAYRAGIGWFGKNANLLLPGGQGSWFVLGCVVTSASLPPSAAPVADGCGSCRRCLDGCPTGAIVAPGVVDANRCLAWLVQRPGSVPRQHREALGDRIYGCDDCQEVCPPNIRLDRRPVADRHSGGQGDGIGRDRGGGRDGGGGRPDGGGDVGQAWVPLLGLLAADDETLLARHGRWYLAGRDPRWLRRNALVALGNSARPDDERVVAVLRTHLHHADPMLRAHAAWALRRLGRAELLADLAGDTSAEVRDELAAPAPAPVSSAAPASGAVAP